MEKVKGKEEDYRSIIQKLNKYKTFENDYSVVQNYK